MYTKEFVKMPHLPVNASAVIVDQSTRRVIIDGLNKLDVEVYLGAKYDNLTVTAGHPDMSITHIGNNEFICAPLVYDYYKNLFSSVDVKLILGEKVGQGNYPNDVAYNIARIGKYAFCNEKYTDNNIKIAFEKLNINVLNINQGYAKCSICIVSENAIITSDLNIAKIALENNIEVLKIESGFIELNGYNYGFIGGTSGKIKEDLIAFAGELYSHPEGIKIENFCMRHNVSTISLCSGNLVDIGSIIPLFERK